MSTTEIFQGHTGDMWQGVAVVAVVCLFIALRFRSR